MSPYREVDHTADWALHVWAATLEALFVDAARGMQALAGVSAETGGGANATRRVVLEAADAESLLVAWLQELLYLGEAEGRVFDPIAIETLTPTRLQARVRGRETGSTIRDIKAVTFHNLAIRPIEGGYEATLVFDV